MAKYVFKVTVTNSPTLILKGNPRRISYTLIQVGDIDIALGAQDGMTYDQGEPFPPGTAISDDQDTDDVFGISSSSNVDIIVIDKLRDPLG